MTYEFEQIGEFTREYTLPISQDALDAQISELTNEVASNAHLKGFRKGRAPRKVISQRYGSAIENDVIEKIVSENCTEILSEEGLQAAWISRPYLAAPVDSPYIYKVRVETMPQIEIGDLSELTIKRPNVHLNDEEIRKQIDDARELCIDWYELDGDEIESRSGDRVWIEFRQNKDQTEETESVEGDDGEALTQVERFPIVLRSPNDDISELLHEKLVGLKVSDELALSSAELRNELGFIGDEVPNDPIVTVVRIDTGDLPYIGEALVERSEFRYLVTSLEDQIIESVEELMLVARASIEHSIEEKTNEVTQYRAMWALAKRSVASIPREVLRQRFLEDSHLGKENVETTAVAYRMFDPIVNGETLDQWFPTAQPDAVEDNDDTPSTGNGQDNAFLEFLRIYWTGEVNRAIQRVAFALTHQALIEQRGIEADQEWIASQIQAQVDNYDLFEERVSREEYLDFVYSDQHYQDLVKQNLSEQALKLLLDEATIEEEDVDFDSFMSKRVEDHAEKPLDSFEVASSLPDPEESMLSATESTEEASTDSESQSDIEISDESTVMDDETIEPMDHDADKKNKSSIFKRLFKKNT